MENISYLILFKLCRNLDHHIFLEKLENLTNTLNDKMRYVNKTCQLKFRYLNVKSRRQLIFIEFVLIKYPNLHIKFIDYS